MSNSAKSKVPMYDRDGYIWMDGEFVPWREAKVHVLTHSLHYGMAVFEGIRAYETAKGAAILRLEEHVERLLESAHILMMKSPWSAPQIEQAIVDSVKKNQLRNAYIRPLLFYGAEEIGLKASDIKVHLMIAAWDWGRYVGDKLKVKISSFTRHHVNVAMCKAKASGHYINSIMAMREASNDGYNEAILLDVDGYVAEGTGANLFMLRRGVLYTPELTSCLDGITRRTIFKLAQDMDIPIVEKRITRDEIYVAEEAFFTGTATEIAAILSVDKRNIGSGEQGAITARFAKAYFDIAQGLDSKYHHWLRFCQ